MMPMPALSGRSDGRSLSHVRAPLREDGDRLARPERLVHLDEHQALVDARLDLVLGPLAGGRRRRLLQRQLLVREDRLDLCRHAAPRHRVLRLELLREARAAPEQCAAVLRREPHSPRPTEGEVLASLHRNGLQQPRQRADEALAHRIGRGEEGHVRAPNAAHDHERVEELVGVRCAHEDDRRALKRHLELVSGDELTEEDVEDAKHQADEHLLSGDIDAHEGHHQERAEAQSEKRRHRDRR
mmetsp:Transcript_20736/g.59221  ORF Transcript_20736/g.59221 Transcript_20736/m.59221 type:complete len:242 (-) Transcript_20736:183-908(-)